MTRHDGSGPPLLDGPTVTRLLPMRDAIEAVRAALAGGLDPDADPSRVVVPVAAGQLLLMPAETSRHVGVKLASVAPANRDLPRIQGVYLLMDAATLEPVALLDGVALTSLRTPAASAVAVAHLARQDASRLVVFGTGQQAWGHVEAMRQVRPIEHVDVVGRRPEPVTRLVEHLRAGGLAAEAATTEAVARADVVCCCTTSRTPVLDTGLIRPHATVVAIGAHEPEARELDEHLLAGATTVVESRPSALREAGDVIQAVHSGLLAPESLTTLAELVRGEVTVPDDRPRVYKSTGMAWQDLVVATAVYGAWTA